MKSFIFLLVITFFVATISYSYPKQNEKVLDLPVITTNKVATQFCAGEYLDVTFEASGSFTTENVFTAQLSDKFGTWTSPIDIGNLNSELPGIIPSRIPRDIVQGYAYRIRVISSEPGVIGSDNGDDITINPVANTNIIGDTIVCNNVVKTYSTVYEDNVLCLWEVSNGELLLDSTGFNIDVQWDRFSHNGKLTLIKTKTGTFCSDTTTINIYIKEPPAVEIAWGDYNVCQGETVGYSAASSTISLYHWEVQGGIILGENNLKDVDVQWNSSGIGYILLRKANQYGCVGEEKKEVIINPRPEANIVGNITGFTGKLSVYHTNYADSLNYLWLVDNGSIQGDSTLDSVQILWYEKGKAHLKLIVTNKRTNCTDTSDLFITIKESINLSPIEGDFEPCAFSIEEYSTENTKNLSLKWFAVNGEILGADNGNSVQVHWSDARGGEIKYVGLDLATSFKDSVSEHININSLPVVTLDDLADVCEKDEPFELSGGKPDGGKYSGDGVQDNRFYPSAAGLGQHLITYSYTNKNNCSNEATKTINVKPSPPKPSISGDGEYFVSSADTGNQWFHNGKPIEGATGKRFRPTEGGAYQVQVTGENGCKSELSGRVLIGVKDNLNFDLTIYPNPSDGNFILTIPNKISDIKIYVYNLLGDLIYQRKITNIRQNEIKLKLNNLNTGIYIINLYFGNQRYIKKLIINK